ncbi:MAG: ribokinase [Terracidiphilus sp.]
MCDQKPIVVVGSINTDLVAITKRIPSVGETVIGTDFQVYPGGKGANQAVAIARLGYPVRMIGRLGTDPFGDQLRANLISAGVDVTGIATSDGASGVAVIVVSSQGENSIVVTPGANSKVTSRDLDANISVIRSAGIVLAQLEIPLETVEHLASLCAQENVPLILDPAPAQAMPPSIFKRTQWLTPNEAEASFYLAGGPAGDSSPDLAVLSQMILATGVYGVVLKLGARGVYLAAQGSPGEIIPAFHVKAVDTTAAGDAFNGGFAVGLMLGKTPQESARFACAVAGISVTRMGAQSSMPTMAEVEDFIQSYSFGNSIHPLRT